MEKELIVAVLRDMEKFGRSHLRLDTYLAMVKALEAYAYEKGIEMTHEVKFDA